MLERIEAALRDFQAGTAIDDRAMLVLRFTGERRRRRAAFRGLTTISGRCPSAPPAGAGAGRTLTIAFESGRRMAPDALRLNPAGATLEVDGLLRAPLRLTLGQLHIGLVDRGPAKVRGAAGRFPVLKRLSATTVRAARARDRGLAVDEHRRLGADAARRRGRRADRRAAVHQAARARAAQGGDGARARSRRSPRARRSASRRCSACCSAVAEAANAETAFRQYGLLRPLTDREVPPTMRRSLPTDQPADPAIDASAPSRSVAPPGF